MHFLITGHTGFKGAWLSLLLRERGHEVSGISLNPVQNSLYDRARVRTFLERDIRCDIRNFSKLQRHVKAINPDVVIHLAAQALVHDSYKDPLGTYGTNVTGTLNVLQSTQNLKGLLAQIIVTTDKVYKNIGKPSGYTEEDSLGGTDPYSASKAMADIATQSWVASFTNAPTAIARAGNVVGGGDVCSNRLIPDLVKSYSSGKVPLLRAPNSVRPWQHVLDCLNGYLVLTDQVIAKQADGNWNFGPNANQVKRVADVANIAGKIWGAEVCWEEDSEIYPREAKTLLLNSEKARRNLPWKNTLDFEASITWAIQWYKNVFTGADPLEECMISIEMFENRLKLKDKS
jgi:CDP-glucose 4,6-dehydratase